MGKTSLIWVALIGALVAEVGLFGLLASARYGALGLGFMSLLSGGAGAAFFTIAYRYRQLSLTDDGTELFNRRYLFRRLSRELRRSNKSGACLSLAVIDVDDFRKYNNAYGHLIGDTVLRQVAGTLRHGVRKGDVVGRWGGEEFALILPKADIEEALIVAERIRCMIDQLRIDVNDRSIETVTISAGVASNLAHGKTLPELVNSADVAMYAAKQQKNFVLAADIAPVSLTIPHVMESSLV